MTISVHLDNLGFASIADAITLQTDLGKLEVTNVSPSSGSEGGVEEVTITGNGFYPDTTSITFGTVACTVVGTVTPSSFKCRMAPSAAGVKAAKVVSKYVDEGYDRYDNNDKNDTDNSMTFEFTCSDPKCKFTFDAAKTPTITSVTPTTLGPAENTITIAGTGFGAS